VALRAPSPAQRWRRFDPAKLHGIHPRRGALRSILRNPNRSDLGLEPRLLDPMDGGPPEPPVPPDPAAIADRRPRSVAASFGARRAGKDDHAVPHHTLPVGSRAGPSRLSPASRPGFEPQR